MIEKKDIIIDYRVIVAVLLIALLGFFYVKSSRVDSNTGTLKEQRNSLPQVVNTSSLPSATAGGVEVIIEDVQRAGGKTLVAVNMNNHVHDLSDPAIVERTTLSGVTAERFESFSNQVGGHHVSGEFWFDGELEGMLIIGVTEKLNLEIELL